MTCICQCTWKALCAIKDAIVSPCTSGEEAQPLADSSVLDDRSADQGIGGITNAGLDDDSFASRSSDQWKPVLQFQDPVTEEPHQENVPPWEVDLGDGKITDTVDRTIGVKIPGVEREDSQSSARESGYGRSLEDSNSSTSPEPSVSIAYQNQPDPTIFKVVVQNDKKCWFILRRYNEFLRLQGTLQQKARSLPLKLPEGETVERQQVDAFIQAIMVDPRIVTLPEVREFLQLDKFRSSSGSSNDSNGSPNTPIILNPKLLMPPGAPFPARKPIPIKGETNVNDDCSFSEKGTFQSQSSIDLGCTEKKSLTPNDFEFLSVVGKGSFGRVMLARYREDNKIYAVKVLNKRMIIRRNETAHVLSERSVLIKMLNHPYLVQLHFAFTTPQKIFFVMDYVNGGELFFHLQKERIFAEPRARFYAAEICCALTYMHSKGIVYRDLKPENILLDTEGHIVLTDFGLCKEGLQTNASKTGTFCGTPEYLAPEILKKQQYSRSVDWWTLGAVLYEMMYGLPPFYSRDTPAMYDAILNKPLKLKHTVSHKARDILQGLLQKDPRDRLGSGIRDGEDVKSHEFFKVIDWNLVNKRGISPPFTPTVNGEADTRNIDPMFTKEAILGQSPASFQGLSASVQAVDHVFQGFSYAPPIEMEGY
ncbi:serine/threonine-protein kinase Sgk2-like [Palaemon carinicauda]|uniref:serine/threonine-protein kinase Sgk2-like n=1 Tax=Palaemon carinicauda TaxID=392227 RepID=UPI0035B577A5